MKQYSYFLVLFICCSFSSLCFATEPETSVTINADTSQIDLHPHFQYLAANKATAGNLAQLLVQNNSADEWRLNSEPQQTNSVNTDGKWFRTELRSDDIELKEWVLKLHWTMFNHVSVFLYDDENQQVVYESTVLNWKIDKNSIDRFPFSFELPLQANKTLSLYLYVNSSDKILMPATLFERHAFLEWKNTRNLLLGLLFGSVFAMLAYNLSLSFFLKERNYIYYCFYIAMITLYNMAMNGIGVSYIWKDNVLINQNVFHVTSLLSFFTAAIFIRHFLHLKKYGGIPILLSNSVLITVILSLIINAISPSILLHSFIDGFELLSCIVGLAISIYIWLVKKDPSGKYLTLSWFALILATFTLMFQLSGLVMFDQRVIYTQHIAFVLEAILLSMALAEWISRERRHRYQAQLEAFKATEEANKYKIREADAVKNLLDYEQNANERLKLEVNERTKDLEILNKKLEHLSQTDPLTQLYNRRYLDHILETEFNRANRQGSELSALMIDIDYFKVINDSYGHNIGDLCLQQVSKQLTAQLKRSYDVCARYGGEEFCILIPGLSQDVVADLAEGIRQNVEAIRVKVDPEEIKFTISIGICSKDRSHITEANELINCADKALYKAKNSGRNRCEIYTA